MFARAVLSVSLLVMTASLGQAEDVALPDNPLRGRLLFESRHCFDCHGFESTGRGPDLAEGNFSGSFLDLGASLWNHVPGMAVQHELHDLPWPALSPPEMVELLAFLYYLDYLGRPGDAERGQSLFQSDGCATCHEPARGQAQGPDLENLTRFASPLYVAQAVWNHGPAMLESMASAGIAPPRFQDGDVADLSAYIRQQGSGSARQRVLLAPGNPNRGHEIFTQSGCSACHSVDGSGGGEGPDLFESDLHRSADSLAGAMWNHAREMIQSMEQRGLAWPSFSTTELADLLAYLYFLPFTDAPGDSKRGQEVFVSRACADCHGDAGEASHAGPELAAGGATDSPAALVAAMWIHAPIMKEAILQEGRPWPTLTGDDLRDLLAYLRQ